MQSSRGSEFFYIGGEANALGGYLETPFERVIPTVAPVSVPAGGGFANGSSEAFSLENLISFRSAYTRVSGQEAEGKLSILVSSIIEGLNILDVVEAERVVAQLSIVLRGPDIGPDFSVAGSTFEGLRIAGRPCHAHLSDKLLALGNRLEPGTGAPQSVEVVDRAPDQEPVDSDRPALRKGQTALDVEAIGRQQATRLRENPYKVSLDSKWLESRIRWMSSEKTYGRTLCSLVDGFSPPGGSGIVPGTCGHVVLIPGFGRFIFGELLLTPDSVQLVSIRADLGCPVKGTVSVNCTGGHGLGDS